MVKSRSGKIFCRRKVQVAKSLVVNTTSDENSSGETSVTQLAPMNFFGRPTNLQFCRLSAAPDRHPGRVQIAAVAAIQRIIFMTLLTRLAFSDGCSIQIIG